MKIDINKRYAWDSGTFKREAIIHSVNGPVDRFPIIASTKTIGGNWETAAHSPEGFIEVRQPREWQIVVSTGANRSYRAGTIDGKATDDLQCGDMSIPTDAWEIIRVREIID